MPAIRRRRDRCDWAGASRHRATRDAEKPCGRCGQGTFGTAVEWVNSVPDAARKAQMEQKLVFVLHVSGMFENAGYT